ncbi:UDP-N-acetylmuramoyl-L-alanyl-D-glutamate--2,6-diaminopimelate ligase [Desulfuribacillus alkaliarsenatis]|uniref:UDP-N-acetylmuramoyl-L-alanyl-D-glutamate--2,6-diaminopimelate ligase n=1 Tax=Desulfuribacillus alkaliarsenatis TaxID=766136 RepID=A0A1E5FZR5_9FIRM|nr:UDP-N-acetylmuramoyl-L-alanyl-D-glutamate--2,6-diaminopimelate ligase [Desulfuribacillus alkaliarsenatis]OEF96077.1 UDP-N-acetylmuramoyl-L-alanyl-D-glutamate--2,6-diaminopimelate ligase [Desulfuribacillus alkaliarsenatis]
MKLMDLISPLLHKDIINSDQIEQVQIKSLTSDSRKVQRGSLFACVPGHTVDGHDYALDAVKNGAVALIAERRLQIDTPQIIVPSIQKALPIIADKFYSHPTRSLKLIGITGTNGKTTTTYLVEKIFKDYGKKTGVIGTIEMRIGEEKYPVANTTPEPISLQENFHMMVEKEVEVAVIEVSSHALELHRVAGCDFDIAVFTNFTQDHLDFHSSLDEYKQAKAKLFSRLGNAYGDYEQKYTVLNADDPEYSYFAAAAIMQGFTYGIKNDADIKAYNIVNRPEGAKFTVDTPLGSTDISLKMSGEFSVYNALAAIAISLLQGVPLTLIKDSLEAVPGVPGRFEKVDVGQDFTIIVDYAHTADSLENVLKTIKGFSAKRIITVFGCGGDRDKSKRPLMGNVSKKYSDISIITSDNPRTEDVKSIIDNIMVAFKDAPDASYIRIDDRTSAIEHAVNIAEKDDVILIAGKGHETYQIIGTQKYDYDDRLKAIEAVRKKDR